MTLTRAAILAGLIGLALVFAAREQIWVILAGPADQGAVDFANITRSGKPNDFLMCPKDLCADAVNPASVKWKPALQEVQLTVSIEEIPAASMYFPEAQTMHMLLSLTLLYLPVGQKVQIDDVILFV